MVVLWWYMHLDWFARKTKQVEVEVSGGSQRKHGKQCTGRNARDDDDDAATREPSCQEASLEGPRRAERGDRRAGHRVPGAEVGRWDEWWWEGEGEGERSDFSTGRRITSDLLLYILPYVSVSVLPVCL